MRNLIIGAAICLTLLSAAAWFLERPGRAWSAETHYIALLVPDGTDAADPRVTVWLDAASEEGLRVIPVEDSAFMRPSFASPGFAGVILPDGIHEEASDLFVAAIHKYVAGGGHLLLVFDAGTKSLQGFYPSACSRLSDLAGVDYAAYQALGDQTIRSAEVSGTISQMDSLGVPPGKYFPFLPQPDAPEKMDADTQLRRYQYGTLSYPNFATSGAYSGKVLLHSGAGLVAGYRDYEKGSVLFVNLPLGYLKSQTDGLPLHVFLKFFAVNLLNLPYMTPVPDGLGGLVLNWHVDSNAAIKPLQQLSNWSLMQQGPYSIDITAGPDTYEIGDGKGFNVLHDPVSQDLIHQYLRMGYEIGSHGGWIHNYFAAHVDTDDPKDMVKFLELNKQALEQVTGKNVVEYSAPNGDQPEWVTHWLESHGFVAYYFTGDTGMGPTQGYFAGHRSGRNIWAFPIAHMDRAASFEEMSAEDVSYDVVQQWLERLTDFVVNRREVRLIYFHPPGILSFDKVVGNWLEKTALLKSHGRFRWYTMADLASFLNERKEVQWHVTNEREHSVKLAAIRAQGLAHFAWIFPKGRFSRPDVVSGSAAVTEESDGWLVVAGNVNELELQVQELNP